MEGSLSFGCCDQCYKGFNLNQEIIYLKQMKDKMLNLQFCNDDCLNEAKNGFLYLKDFDYRICNVDKAISEKKLNKPEKIKYIVPKALTMGQFAYIIRKRITLKPEESLFLFVNDNTLPPTAATIEQIYEEYKLNDGFLYMTFASENTFG